LARRSSGIPTLSAIRGRRAAQPRWGGGPYADHKVAAAVDAIDKSSSFRCAASGPPAPGILAWMSVMTADAAAMSRCPGGPYHSDNHRFKSIVKIDTRRICSWRPSRSRAGPAIPACERPSSYTRRERHVPSSMARERSPRRSAPRSGLQPRRRALRRHSRAGVCAVRSSLPLFDVGPPHPSANRTLKKLRELGIVRLRAVAELGRTTTFPIPKRLEEAFSTMADLKPTMPGPKPSPGKVVA